MSTFDEVIKSLRAPFKPEDLAWLPVATWVDAKGPAAVLAPYVDARAVMDRLDTVMGVENWQDSYSRQGDGFIGVLKLRINDEWLEKSDGAEDPNWEPYKGGLSGALKRAAAKWGIGRYLYDVPALYGTPCKKDDTGSIKVEIKQKGQDRGEIHWFQPPRLPQWALPAGYDPKTTVPQPKAEEPPPKMGRQSLQTEVYKTAKRKGISEQVLGDLANDLFKLKLNLLSAEQLEQLLKEIS